MASYEGMARDRSRHAIGADEVDAGGQSVGVAWPAASAAGRRQRGHGALTCLINLDVAETGGHKL